MTVAGALSPGHEAAKPAKRLGDMSDGGSQPATNPELSYTHQLQSYKDLDSYPYCGARPSRGWREVARIATTTSHGCELLAGRRSTARIQC
jgi:hypothetical protein